MFNLGLRWALTAAFAGVASLTFVASIVAFLSYAHIGLSLQRVEDDAVPAVMAAQGLARESAELSAIAARVIAAKTGTQLDDVTALLEPQGVAMHASLHALAATSVGSDIEADLARGVEEMLASTRDLAAAARQRLESQEARQSVLAAAASAHRAVIEKLAPLSDDAKYNLIMGLDGLAGLASRDAVLHAIDALDQNEAGLTRTLDEIRAEANQALAILAETAIVSDKDLLPSMNERILAARNQLLKLAAKLDQDAASNDLPTALDGFLRLGDANTGMAAARGAELRDLERCVTLIAVNHDKATQLAGEVQKTVRSAGQTSTRAVTASRNSIGQGEILLFVLVLFNLLVAGSIIYFFVEKGVVLPLTRLKDVALALASGNFEVNVPRFGGSEIGRVAAAIDIFKQNGIRARDLDFERQKRLEAEARRREKIEAYIGAFDKSGRELSSTLAAASVEMGTTARVMNDSAQEAGQEVTNVNMAAAQAAECVRRAAEAAEEMSQSIRDICERIGESSRIALRAVDEAKRADATMRGMMQVAGRIGEVVDLIRQVASQTNLLALNATIEAARAGAAGRGFAVVAGEVKDLAMQTEKATQDVAAQVAAIAATAEDAVEAISTINATIEKMNDIAGAIAVAMAQQSVATAEITKAVHIAAESTNQVNQSIKTVDRGVAGTGTAACRVLAASADLGQRAGALQSEIAQFLGEIRVA